MRLPNYVTTLLYWTTIVSGYQSQNQSDSNEKKSLADGTRAPTTSASLSVNECCQCKFNDTPYIETSCGSSGAFMILLQSLMMARCDIADPCNKPGISELPDDQLYDFIVVGAGVAGPVLARRLSDFSKWKVLLIEAGPSEPTMTAIPGLAFNAIGSSLDWSFSTEPTYPKPTACLETGGVCTWPRGKMISGSGGLNGMMYIRGHPEIYNKWARDGSTGWSWDEIQKYFERAENPADPQMVSDQPRRETKNDGPMRIEHFHHKPIFADELLSAASELGYRTTYLHGFNHTGFMRAPIMTSDGLRGNTARYYLRPIAKRNNLHILTNAHVTKILVSDSAGTAYGVEHVDEKGDKRVVKTKKEVILTAGAIGSPQILMNSGIGPAEHLKKVGIKTIGDLPVGQNLHNHVSIGLSFSINDTYYQTLTSETINQFVTSRDGPLSSTGITQITAFLETSFATGGMPDIQVFFDGFSSRCSQSGLAVECSDGTIDNCPTRRAIVIRPTVVDVRTTGYMQLRSTNPVDPPLLYPNYFSDERDLQVLVEGVNKILELTKTPSMKKWDLQLDTTPLEQCADNEFGSNAYWACVIRVQTGPENHQSGSCKMGSPTDTNTVVDPKLRVLGFPNIRVADASIFPVGPNSNPSAAIIMVAEKASDLIRDTWA